MSNEQTPPQYKEGQEIQTPEESANYIQQLNGKWIILDVQRLNKERELDQLKAAIKDIENEITILQTIIKNKLPIYKNKGTN